MQLTIDQDLKAALKPELEELNRSFELFAKKTDGFLGDLLSYVLAGSGKRVRPALVMLSSRLGSPNPEDVKVVAEAVELVHIATLIHDDVIDNAVLRRGRKTVAAQYGVDAAVLLGDHVYTYAFERAADTKNPIILQLLAHATSLMCRGEIEQLEKRFQFDITEADYFSFIEKKTASLFGVSARAGAILAGQDLNVQKALQEFGRHLGIAFQIVDDLLDITGDEDVVGKTLRTDLMYGKMTLPLIHYRDQVSSSHETSVLIENLKHPNGHLGGLIENMKSAGSLVYTEETALHYIQKSLDLLKGVPESPTRDHLTALAEMLLRRKA